MILENELLMVLLGIVTLVFILANYSQLIKFKGFYWIGGAFLCMLLGWVFTLLEGIVWFSFFNILEHACYLAGAILFVCWLAGLTRQKESHQ